jgi:hypothetical protein
MKKLRNLIAVMAMMSMAAVLTGCGDDDDDDDDDGGVLPPQIVAPADEAALTAPNNTYTVSVSGQNDPIVLTFPASGQYQMVQSGVTETGTITGATRTDNTWTMNIIPAAGQEGAAEGVLTLDFTAANAGIWTFTPTGGQVESGTFALTTGGGNTDGGTDGGADGGTDGGGDDTVLTGKTLQITYPSAGGERFDFTSESAVAYEPASANIPGTYTWDPATRQLNVSLNNGWLYEISIPAGGNAATVVFRESAGSEPSTDAATYTLQ